MLTVWILMIKQKYAETEKMLADVRKASDKYQSEYEKFIKSFSLKYRNYLLMQIPDNFLK